MFQKNRPKLFLIEKNSHRKNLFFSEFLFLESKFRHESKIILRKPCDECKYVKITDFEPSSIEKQPDNLQFWECSPFASLKIKKL